MTSKEAKKQIQELVAQDELEAAIKLLASYFENNKRLDDILMQSAQYHAYQKGLRNGLISFAEVQQQLNYLRSNILSFIREEQASTPSIDNIQKEIQSDYKHAIAKVCTIRLLSHHIYMESGLSITSLQKHSRVKNRKYIATTIRELEAYGFVIKNGNDRDENTLYKLTETGIKLADEFDNSILGQ
ncbi:MAG: hypothetical protein MI974_04790 [Chitinophagales bacterium]|nr:hypothetical protein [Chitinophagales bacterium]